MQHIMASEDEDVVSADGAMGEWGGQLDRGKTGQCAIGRLGDSSWGDMTMGQWHKGTSAEWDSGKKRQ
jgi:hypothetical protein